MSEKQESQTMAQTTASDCTAISEEEVELEELEPPPRKKCKRNRKHRYLAPSRSSTDISKLREVPSDILEAATNTRSELYRQYRQRYYNKKHEEEKKKNTIVSIYKDDILTRVVMSESLPYICGLCGESFAQTSVLKRHVEEKHHYFEDLAEKDNTKKQIVVQRKFSPDESLESPQVKNGHKGHGILQAEITHEKESERGLGDGSDDDILDTSELSEANIAALAEKGGDSGAEENETQTSSSRVVPEAHADSEEVEDINGIANQSLTKGKKNEGTDAPAPTGLYEQEDSSIKVQLKDKSLPIELDGIAKAKKTMTPYCVVCGIQCKTRVTYRRHLADAHCIFSSLDEVTAYLHLLDEECNDIEFSEDDVERIEKMETDESKLGVNIPMVGGKSSPVIKCRFCWTFVLHESVLQKHMRAHCGLPGIKCDICIEGIRLWEDGKISEVRSLMEKFYDADRQEGDKDFLSEAGKSASDVDNQDMGDDGSFGSALKDNTLRFTRFCYSNVVSSCCECGEKFYMRFHMGHHHKKAHDQFTCKLCGTTVPSLAMLKKHSQKNHKKGIFQCKYCPRAFHDRGKYTYHKAGHMGIYKCPGCGRTFLEKPSLDNHLQKNANNPSHFQPGANATTNEYSKENPYLFDGYFEKPDQKSTSIKCTVCDALFTNLGNLTKHLNARHAAYASTNLTHVCSICGMMFGSKTNLTTHKRLHNKKHICPHPGCGKLYHVEHKLKEHVMSHSSEASFYCEHCPKSFKTASAFRYHRRSHSNSAPFRCTVCQSTFWNRTDLRQHAESVHNLERNYQCEVCGRTFLTQSRLMDHAVSHGEKKFSCSKCSMSFPYKRRLDAHERVHNRAFPCSECPKSFDKEDLLNRHMYAKHNIGDPPARISSTRKRRTKIQDQEHFEEEKEEGVLNFRVEIPGEHEVTNEVLIAMLAELKPLKGEGGDGIVTKHTLTWTEDFTQ